MQYIKQFATILVYYILLDCSFSNLYTNNNNNTHTLYCMFVLGLFGYRPADLTVHATSQNDLCIFSYGCLVPPTFFHKKSGFCKIYSQLNT